MEAGEYAFVACLFQSGFQNSIDSVGCNSENGKIVVFTRVLYIEFHSQAI